jgi:phosphoglycolate phosphatase
MKIYIDYDGPILNIKKKCWNVHTRVIEELGGKVTGNSDQYWTQKRNGVERKKILGECNIDASQEDAYVRLFTAIVETDEYLRFDSLVPNVINTLERLSKEHELVMVTVRKNQVTAREQMERLKLIKYFSQLLIGSEQHNESGGKAKERMIRSEESMSKIKGKIIVGDSNHEISAAKLLQIPSVVVLNGFRSKKYLQSYHPTYIIKNITELPHLLEHITL